ncbi:MAG TPA: hypothetical protein VFI08_10690 [Spirochaetia bacterium]|nr:hypothetical protein [Spirochaetia bacterium]
MSNGYGYRTRFEAREWRLAETARNSEGGGLGGKPSHEAAMLATAAGAWGQGRVAADAGKLKSSCPFTGTLLSRLWVGGWCERQLELAQDVIQRACAPLAEG